MKILFLGNEDSPVAAIIRRAGDEVVVSDEKLDLAAIQKRNIDFIVSHGYRHIIRPDIIDNFPKKIINLHISLLPWNRGADPNFWSFIENSPKGVSIHYLDEGVDTGEIIVQKECFFSGKETLKSSYEKLQSEIISLFELHWNEIRSGVCSSRAQVGAGTSHKMKDKEPYQFLVAKLGYDTLVEDLTDFLKKKTK